MNLFIGWRIFYGLDGMNGIMILVFLGLFLINIVVVLIYFIQRIMGRCTHRYLTWAGDRVGHPELFPGAHGLRGALGGPYGANKKMSALTKEKKKKNYSPQG